MRISLLAVMVLALGASVSLARDASPADQKFFESHLTALIKMKVEPIDNAALKKVFAADFFNVVLNISDSQTATVMVGRLKEEVFNLTKPSTEAEIPGLARLFKPDFKLMTDADSQALQDALDVLYPVNRDDVKVKAILHDGNKWSFIRRKFFDNFDGLVFTTDANGTVTGVNRSLGIKK